MAIISTTVNCKECEKKDFTARLSRDLTTDEYFCAQGHKFKESDLNAVSEAQAIAPAAERGTVEETTETAAPEPLVTKGGALTPVGEMLQKEHEEAVGSMLHSWENQINEEFRSGSGQFEPPPISEQQAANSAVNAEIDKVTSEIGFTSGIPHPCSTILPGGDAYVMVRIPERHVQSLTAEAANQEKRWEEFFQERLHWVLDQGVF